MSSLFFSYDLFNFMSLVFEGWFILSLLPHHLFYIWNVNGNRGVFCEMSTKRNPGSPQDGKTRPLVLKWDGTMQIHVGMACFSLAPGMYGDACTRVGVTSLLIRATIHQHSPFLVMWLQAHGASRRASVEDADLWLPSPSGDIWVCLLQTSAV